MSEEPQSIILNWAGSFLRPFWNLTLLLMVLAVVVGFAVWFQASTNGVQNREDLRAQLQREFENDQEHHRVLQSYMDRITDLVIHERLGTPEVKPGVSKIAGAWTLATLRDIDQSRKSSIIQFLWDSDLVNGDSPSISLSGADLNDVDLSGIQMHRINLSGVNLRGANLERSDLSEAILEDANLTSSILRGTTLLRANLFGASLFGADLRSANLQLVNLSDVDLRSANFGSVEITNVEEFEDGIFGVVDGTAGGFSPGDNGSFHFVFSEGPDLSYADLSGAILREVDLRAAPLNGTILNGADLSSANLSVVPYSDVHSIAAQGFGSDLRHKFNLEAYFDGTGVNDNQLAQAGSLVGVTMPDGSKIETEDQERTFKQRFGGQ